MAGNSQSEVFSHPPGEDIARAAPSGNHGQKQISPVVAPGVDRFIATSGGHDCQDFDTTPVTKKSNEGNSRAIAKIA